LVAIITIVAGDTNDLYRRAMKLAEIDEAALTLPDREGASLGASPRFGGERHPC